MLKSNWYLGWFAIVAVLVGAIGCEPDFVDAPAIAEVQGKVFLDGQPVEDARVVFIPLKDSRARDENSLGYGVTDAQGNFTLKRANGEPGVCRGLHRVFISKKSEQPQQAGVQSADLELQDDPVSDSILLMPSDYESDLRQPDNELIPVIYNLQSTLEFNVDSTLGLVRAKFELTSVDPLLVTKQPNR